jgi:hypothetical protein
VDNTTSRALAASGLPISEFDGGANIWANSMGDLMAMGSLFFLNFDHFFLPEAPKFSSKL